MVLFIFFLGDKSPTFETVKIKLITFSFKALFEKYSLNLYKIFLFCGKNFLIEVYLIYKVVLVSDVHQSDSITHKCIIFHYDLLQDNEYNFLCYAAVNTTVWCAFYIALFIYFIYSNL